MKITEKEFNLLTGFIKANYGIYIKPDKVQLFTGRLENLLATKNIENFTDYFNYIMSDKTGFAVNEMLNKITTNHTAFMREINHFNFFRDNVLPYLSSTVKDKDLRIWSAACSSGEEAYTLAMYIDDFFKFEKEKWDTTILATDISSAVIEKAKIGIYSEEQIKPIPPNWKYTYLKKLENGNYEFKDNIKNEILFRNFNLMEERYPFKKTFHVIFCRNVMIYFDNKTKDNLIEKLYNKLENGGYLFIGHSETIDKEKLKLKYVIPSVFRKEL